MTGPWIIHKEPDEPNRPIIRGYIREAYYPGFINNFNFYAFTARRRSVPLAMNPKKERELVVFTWLADKGIRTVTEIQTELGLEDDADFPLDITMYDLVKEGHLVQKSETEEETDSWEITEKGRIYMKDLAQDKYEEKNKIPVYIWGVLIVIAILTFIKLFPRMFHG